MLARAIIWVTQKEISEGKYHKVEPCHEKDHINQEHPVSFQGDLSFCNKCGCNISAGFSGFDTLSVGTGLGQAESENDDQDWWAGTEPEERSPAMWGGVDKGACKCSG